MDIGGMNNSEGENQQVGAGRLIRKGQWTQQEDQILTNYVMTNGAEDWDAVSRKSGLSRCDYSCRSRWVNQLQPGIKTGPFSAKEEAIIVNLHSQIGNKWAKIALQLRGRTDNAVKNFWHARMRQRRKAGLPMYPTESEKQKIQNCKYSAPLISTNLSTSSIQSDDNIIDCSSKMTTLTHPLVEQIDNNSYVLNNNVNHNNNYYNSSALSGDFNTGFIDDNYNFYSSALSSANFTQVGGFDLCFDPIPLLGSQTHDQTDHEAMYTTTPSDYIFNQHSNANMGLLQDIVNQAKNLQDKTKKNNEVNQSYEGPLNVNDMLLHGRQNLIQENQIQESRSSFLPMGTNVTATLSMEENTANFGNFLNTCQTMSDWYNMGIHVPTIQSSTMFNNVLTELGNQQEIFNSSNSLAMQIPQPFLDNSGHRNIMPRVPKSFNDNGNGNVTSSGNIPGFQW